MSQIVLSNEELMALVQQLKTQRENAQYEAAVYRAKHEVAVRTLQATQKEIEKLRKELGVPEEEEIPVVIPKPREENEA